MRAKSGVSDCFTDGGNTVPAIGGQWQAKTSSRQALLLGLGFIRPLFIADQTNSVKPYLNSAQYRLLIMMAGAE
ncbi:hypothetical protein QNH99_18235 [Pantoea allii]|uniref:hypothetical protein n=1 Tax=Pantoea allii TaxID=574096 RepID=UPI000D6C7475|nr:hypothetical protein [Pantoea allii]